MRTSCAQAGWKSQRFAALAANFAGEFIHLFGSTLGVSLASAAFNCPAEVRPDEIRSVEIREVEVRISEVRRAAALRFILLRYGLSSSALLRPT